MLKGLTILLVGVFVVMLVLVLLWTSTALTGMTFKAIERAKVRARDKQAAKAASVEAPVEAVPAGIPPHHLAAIAAAAATALGGSVRVVSVHAPPLLQASLWTSQGRLQTFQSSRRQGDWGRAIGGLTKPETSSRPD